MAGPRTELADAVQHALDWLGLSPDDAAPVMGLNARTLTAMSQGIVPMRSLVIRFAAEMGRLQKSHEGAAAWWGDVDAWLDLAGYPPRRDVSGPESTPVPGTEDRGPSYRLGGPAGARSPRATDTRFAHDRGPTASNNGQRSEAPRRPVESPPYPLAAGAHSTTASPPPNGRAAVASPVPPTSIPPSPGQNSEVRTASETYRPQYERLPWGEGFVHVFWILDGENRRIFQIRVAPNYDYKARAAEVKRDLAGLTTSQFDRKYGRFRIDSH